MTKRYLASLLVAVFAFAVGAPAIADDPEDVPAKPSPNSKAAVPAETPDAVTHHTVSIGGRAIAYTARAGTITVHNDKDQPAARVFYTAYTEDNAANRPITFLYNGGPGSSTMWLRMGSFGPVRVETSDGTPTGPPPYRLVNNQSSLLDKTDLVFIDMPDSGFGRIIGAGTPKEFFGVDQDVRAFGQFVELYISRFSRWNSPKFLFGESYGTTRSAALVDYLQGRGIAFNGVVLLSSILNFGLDYADGGPIGGGDWAYVLYLPTEAATAWFHNRLRNKPASLADFLHSVEGFAMSEYLDALSKGDAVPAAQKDDVVRKLHEYTGISEQYIRNSNLRVPYWRFEKELLRTQDKVVGRLDSRFETYELDSAGEAPNWDPTEVAISAAFVATGNQYLREQLRYDTAQLYRANVYDIIEKAGGWDFKHHGAEPTNVAPDLAESMTQNPNLHVFSANGYYDFATPYFATVYTLNHLNLAPALQRHITYGNYESGHMVYLNVPSLVKFKDDLARWYDAVLSGR